jgi:hypothetical protein
MPDEVARIGALSNGSNGQRSLESASLHLSGTAGVSEPQLSGRIGVPDTPHLRVGVRIRRRNPEPKAEDLV